MSITKARKYLKQFGADKYIKEFEVSSATVELAAKALCCQPERIAKTLSFEAETGCVLIVAAGDAKIDNQKYKAEFAKKPKMLQYDMVESLVGHAPGGVCPFGVNENVLVYLDESLKRFSTVFPACGSENSAIELSIQQLEDYSKYIKWVNVCKLPECE